MKRSIESEGDGQPLKRRKQSKGPLRSKHRQPGAIASAENLQDAEQMEQELSRAISIALYACGFDAVKSSALESFRAAVDEYMQHFVGKVQKSMQHCRRTQPTAQDFAYALSSSGLQPETLLRERDLRIPFRVTQAPLIPQRPDKVPSQFDVKPFAASDSGQAKEQRRYIPRHFPAFPSQHAYQDTPVFTRRVTDALSIRERAMEEGQLVEQSLRKLMAASKVASQSGRGGIRRRPLAVQERSEKLWKEALLTMKEEDAKLLDDGDRGSKVSGSDGIGGDDDGFVSAVNYDRRYWRRGNSTRGLIIG